MSDTNELLQALLHRVELMDAKLDALDGIERRFDAKLERLEAKMDARFEKLEARMDKMDERFDRLDADVAGIRQDTRRILRHMDAVEADLDRTITRVEVLEAR